MRVALYQINSDRDTFNTKFMSWRWRTDHDYIILPEEYDKVFDGDIQASLIGGNFCVVQRYAAGRICWSQRLCIGRYCHLR